MAKVKSRAQVVTSRARHVAKEKWEPTLNLRFYVDTEGHACLQQEWTKGDEKEWCDVPSTHHDDDPEAPPFDADAE